MMLHSELVTSIQERRKINVVLLDNMTFGCINNLQMEHGMDSFGTEFRFRDPASGKLDGDFVPVDFAMSAAAYGCKTYKVNTRRAVAGGPGRCAVADGVDADRYQGPAQDHDSQIPVLVAGRRGASLHQCAHRCRGQKP